MFAAFVAGIILAIDDNVPPSLGREAQGLGWAVIYAVVGGDAHRPRADGGFGTAYQHLISRLTRGQHHAAERLDRGAQVERDRVR